MRLHRPASFVVAPWQVVVAVFLLLVGMLTVAQWRSQRPLRAQTQLPSVRAQELAVLLRREEEARQALEQEVAGLRRQVEAYQKAVIKGQGAAETMARETAHFEAVLGLTAVQGPGVVVRLRSSSGGGILPVQTRAADLSGLINELWSAGAEAVSVNRVRVLATTGFRDRADGVVAAGTLLLGPFTIEAIGEPLTMEAALRIRGGFVEGLQSIGLGVEVRREPKVRLEPYRGLQQLQYARPLRGLP